MSEPTGESRMTDALQFLFGCGGCLGTIIAVLLLGGAGIVGWL